MVNAFVPGASGALYAASLFGYGELGAQGFAPENHRQSAQTQHFARLESYFRNRQHDDKNYSWGGYVLPRREPGHQPLLSSAKLDYFPDLHERRPSAPYRLAPFIVRSFTSLLFGEGRFPKLFVPGDSDSQDYVTALAEACGLAAKMQHARNLGGCAGTVGMSWRFWQGKPRLQVHPRSTLHVQDWEDPEEQIPRVVTKIVRVQKEVVDEEKGLVVREFWRRRDWTPIADVVFVDQEVDARDREWVIDDAEGATTIHDEGFCHFVWIANHPGFDGEEPDGESDFGGNVEACDALDVVNSATVYGGAKNIEPTLLLKLDEAALRGIRRVQKGSDRALPVGKGGDANYLEVSGASITAGISLVQHLRSAILETSQVVAPDPDKVAAAGSSSVALKMIYAPMLAPAAGLRTTYGRAIVRLLDQMIRSIRARQPISDGEERVYSLAPGSREGTESQLSVPSDGTEQNEKTSTVSEEFASNAEEEIYVDLPPRVVEAQPTDPVTGLPVGEKITTLVPRKLGAGGEIALSWPEWFEPTAEDRHKDTTTLSAAAGGRAVLSQETAVERASQLHKVDPAREWLRLSAQQQAEREAQQGMFPPAGDVVQQTDPAKGPVDEAQAVGQDVKVVPEAVLNGAQVQAALAIVIAVADGTMPRDAGLGQLEVLFNLQPGQALKMLGSVGTEPPKVVPTTPP